MEFAIPISRFDPTHVHWGQPRSGPFRRTIPFGYDESNIQLNNLILILQPLRIVEIDWMRNQIVLEESKKLPFLSRLEQFQTLVTNEIENQSRHWLNDCKPPSGTSISLQPWLKSKKLTLYLSAQPDTLPFFTESGSAVFSEKTIKPGDILRAVVKIQGVSLQMSEDDIWTGKSRIQHHILQLYKVSSAE
jgi:hypothetical protein